VQTTVSVVLIMPSDRAQAAMSSLKVDPGGYTDCDTRFWMGCMGSSRSSFHFLGGIPRTKRLLS